MKRTLFHERRLTAYRMDPGAKERMESRDDRDREKEEDKGKKVEKTDETAINIRNRQEKYEKTLSKIGEETEKLPEDKRRELGLLMEASQTRLKKAFEVGVAEIAKLIPQHEILKNQFEQKSAMSREQKAKEVVAVLGNESRERVADVNAIDGDTPDIAIARANARKIVNALSALDMQIDEYEQIEAARDRFPQEFTADLIAELPALRKEREEIAALLSIARQRIETLKNEGGAQTA